MKVLMVPHALSLQSGESGIHTLVRKYFEHLPNYGVELVDAHATSFDVLAVHAGMSREYPDSGPLVSHLHGLYWTADYSADSWEYKANAAVIESIRQATLTTVPSPWVAEALQRDMHLDPYVVPHGIDWQEWEHGEPNEGYILWNKNRVGDVCNPASVGELARRFPQKRFLTTFAPEKPTPNIKATGVVKHDIMRRMVQRSAVYLATTKETFGIGILEAMASGVPVLGFNHGGASSIIQHGVNGYLAEPANYDDLAKGLDYCLKHRKVLGANGQHLVKRYSWGNVAEQLAGLYNVAQIIYNEPSDVAVIIPCYNYADQLRRAVESAVNQTYPAKEIIIVDNNSSDNTSQVARALADQYDSVRYVNEEKQGVAHARNRGVRESITKYVCCLDADDAIEPGFLAACVKALDADRSLGVAYTRLKWIRGDGSSGVSDWPAEYNYDNFLRKQNQVPTCCVYRREMWQRLGGYRQRYAPHGAGAEDAEFFLRAGAAGWGGKLATQDALFVYSWGTGRVSGNPQYQEADWLGWHPWIHDKRHPFASQATPHHFSHMVRQYDEPDVSVVIPCGPSHVQFLVDALDSLEAQTFRTWEAIVVADNATVPDELKLAYPFVNWLQTDGIGAGGARNAGAAVARSPMLLFLDADDWLKPDAIERMMQVWNQEGAITYTDYHGHAYMDDGMNLERLRMAGRLHSYDQKTQEAIIIHNAYDFDCEQAIRQPELGINGEFYIWSLITSLTPKIWHDEIGGFDESMESWEDWDYWIRMARAGKCFVRLPVPLIDYRFYTGTRRETGRQIHKNLLEYLKGKYERSDAMACSGCSKNRAPVVEPVRTPSMFTMNAAVMPQMSPDDIVWAEIVDGNIGNHHIVGDATKTSYGYRKHGDRIKMVAKDVQIAPRKYRIIDPDAGVTQRIIKPVTVAPEPVAIVEVEPVAPTIVMEETPEPEYLAWEPEVVDFTAIWGINEDRAKVLQDAGIRSIGGLLTMNETKLETLLNVNTTTAKRILSDAASKA